MLLVEPDEALSTIPFQALVDSQEHYLVVEHPIAYLTALRYLGTATNDPPINPAMKALVVANDAENREAGVRALPDAIAEAEGVAGRFSQALLLTNSDASLNAVRAALPQADLRAKMVLQVHDELVFEIPEAERSVAGALVKREMEGVAHLGVPLVVTIGAGRNWIDAKA